MDLLTHYTLNSGHSRESPRSEVGDDIIAKCQPWLEGDHELPFPGWTIMSTAVDGGLICTVSCELMPVVTCGVAATNEAAAEVWKQLEWLYLSLTDMPQHRAADWKLAKEPTMLPWLCTIMVEPGDIYRQATWLGDFERCVAWAFIDRES